MAPRKKYTTDVAELMRPLRKLLGTPKHAFELLRCEEIGITWNLFYRAWREDRTTAACARSLGVLIPSFFVDVRECTKDWQDTSFRVVDSTVEQARHWMKATPPWEDDEDEDEL